MNDSKRVTSERFATLTAALPVATSIQIVGTPLPGWKHLARALRDSAAATGLLVHGEPLVLGPDSESVLDETVRQPNILFVALVENPEVILGRALETEPVGGAAAISARWTAGARMLLRLAQAQPHRIVMLDVEDATAAPAALAASVRGWAGRAEEAVGVTVQRAPPVDPLRRMIARMLLSGGDRAATTLYDELLAGCLRLSEVQAPGGGELASAVLEHFRNSAAEPAAARNEASTASKVAQAEATLHEARRQLAELQQEVEKEYLRASALEREIVRAGLDVDGSVQADTFRVLHVRDEGVHRHVHIALSRVRHGRHEIPALELRLVEHSGRPGLVIFSTGADREALFAWHPNGEESGRGYMLLMPTDATGCSRLLRLGTLDWTMVLGLARIIRHDISSAEAMPGRWRTVAARLLRQLEVLPARLRYDRLAIGSGPDGTVEAVLEHVIHGSRALGDVRLRFAARDNALVWLAPDDSQALPLPDWPADAQGRLAPAYRLPLGGGRPAKELREAWVAAAPEVRAVYLDLLAPLLGASAAPVELRRAARAMRRQALALQLRAQVYAVARRLLRRGQRA